MKMRSAIAVVLGLSMLMTGCVTTNTPLNEALFPPSQVTVAVWGDGSGYQPTFAIDVPPDACDSEAYVDGFKDSFISNWNPTIRTKYDLFRLRAMNNRKDAAAVANRDMYQAKLIGTKRGYVSNLSKYQPKYGMRSNLEMCQQNSYYSGKQAGAAAVLRERELLVANEK